MSSAFDRLKERAHQWEVTIHDKDQAATEFLAQVMLQMQEIDARAAPALIPTVQDWACSFERYLNTIDKQIPLDLVKKPVTGI